MQLGGKINCLIIWYRAVMSALTIYINKLKFSDPATLSWTGMDQLHNDTAKGGHGDKKFLRGV